MGAVRARGLLIATAVAELATGGVLLAVPSLPVKLLFAEQLPAPVAVVLARVAGAALVAIGATCWLARDATPEGRPDLIAGLLVYNATVATILIHAATVHGLRGIALWPAVLLHVIFALWCISWFRSRDA